MGAPTPSGDHYRALERVRLEREMNVARWAGALLTFSVGPFFGNVGQGALFAFGLFILVYAFTIMRYFSWAEASGARALQLTRIGYSLDLLLVVIAMYIFSPDVSWTTFIVGGWVITTGAFRFGSQGAILATAILALSYVALTFFRQQVYGYSLVWHLLLFHLSFYIVTATLIATLLRRLQLLRAQRDALAASNEDARVLVQADSLRRDFLTQVAHDLRTPLTVLRMSTDILRKQITSEGALRHLERIDLATRRLQDFTDAMRTLVHLEDGQLLLERTETNLGELVQSVAKEHEGLAEASGQQIVVSLPTTSPTLNIDAFRVRQVIANLLANAIRYAPEESRIEIELSSGDDVTVSVRDHGQGVPKLEQSSIFNRFYRGKTHDKRYPGSGLGLSIASSLATLHGGEVTYEDTPGGGATFVLHLPFDSPSQAAKQVA